MSKAIAEAKYPVDVGRAPKDAEVIEGIHVLLTRNKTFYTENALREALNTWISPYNKPLIKNHDTETEPFGRVIGAAITKSIVKPEYTTARLYLDVRDPDAKEKLKDGRYQTFSIGASVDSVTCSICNRDILKEDYCGHMKGRRYDGKVCTWTIESIASFDEISVVNVPSDPIAVRITQMIRQGEVKEGMNKAGEMDREELLRTIEAAHSLLEQDEQAGEAEPEEQIEESAEDETELTEDADVESDNDVVTVESVQAELVTARETLATKEAEVTELGSKVALLETDLAAKIADLQALQEQLTAKEAAVQDGRQQNLKLARLATHAYREHAVTLAIFTGQAASREEAEARFASERLDALQTYVSESIQTMPTRPEQTVNSPAQMGAEDETTKGSQEASGLKIETVADFEKLLSSYMTRKR